MKGQDDEEKVLLSREYEKHLGDIKKAQMREKHYKYKDEGYTDSLNQYANDIKCLCVLIGYVANSGIDKEEFFEILSKEMLKGKIDVYELTRNVINKNKQTPIKLDAIFKEL